MIWKLKSREKYSGEEQRLGHWLVRMYAIYKFSQAYIGQDDIIPEDGEWCDNCNNFMQANSTAMIGNVSVSRSSYFNII